MSCPYCLAALGCAVDCPNAPWNFDKPRATRLTHLTRLVRWCRPLGAASPNVGFTLGSLRWLR